jgi:UDP-glucose 4-epimerase
LKHAEHSVRRLIYTNSCLENQVTSNPALAANPYVCSKYFATLLVNEAARRDGRFTAILTTLFSVYGEDDDEENLINFVIGCLRRGKVAELGSGKAIRDWIYVEDAAEALVALAQDRHNNTHYHIGTATGMTVRDVAEKIATILQQTQNLHFGTITDRGDELMATIADAEKLVPNLPPPQSLEEALPRLLSSSQFATAH